MKKMYKCSIDSLHDICGECALRLFTHFQNDSPPFGRRDEPDWLTIAFVVRFPILFVTRSDGQSAASPEASKFCDGCGKLANSCVLCLFGCQVSYKFFREIFLEFHLEIMIALFGHMKSRTTKRYTIAKLRSCRSKGPSQLFFLVVG